LKTLYGRSASSLARVGVFGPAPVLDRWDGTFNLGEASPKPPLEPRLRQVRIVAAPCDASPVSPASVCPKFGFSGARNGREAPGGGIPVLRGTLK